MAKREKPTIPVAEAPVDFIGDKPVNSEELALAHKILWTSPEGAIVMADLVRRFGRPTSNMYNEHDPSSQGERVVYYEGQRSVLVHIGRYLYGDPAEFRAQNTEGEGL